MGFIKGIIDGLCDTTLPILMYMGSIMGLLSFNQVFLAWLLFASGIIAVVRDVITKWSKQK